MKSPATIAKEIRPLLKLAIPLAITGLVQAAVWFFEVLFLAQLGTESLAAGALVSWLFGTLTVILFGILSSINILVAHEHGANEAQNIRFLARDGLVLATLLAVPAFLLVWNMAPIFLLFGQPESIVVIANSYLHPLALGILPNFLAIACLEVIMGVGRARSILYFSLLSVSLNIILSYLFIFGKYGFPALGVAGAGWGASTSYWLTIVILTLCIFYNKKYRKYFTDLFNFKGQSYLWELIHIGLPMGFMYCFEVAFFFALTLLMGVISTQLQAANQIVMQYLGLFMSMMFAIAQAITVRMGHLLGAYDVSAAKKANYIGLGIAAFTTGIVALVYWFYPTLLISVDINVNDPKNFTLVAEIEGLLAVSAVFQILEAIRIAYFGSLRALKDTRFAMLVSIISFWAIALPIGYVIAIPLAYGATGFWWSMVIGAGVSVALLHYRFKKLIKRYQLHYEGSLSAN